MSKWKMVALNDVCEFIKDGTHQTPTYSETGYIFLSSKNVTSEVIDWKNIKYIPKELHEKLYKVLKPQINDILLAKNGTTGIAAIVDKDEIFDVYVSLAVLRPKLEVIYPKYLLCSVNSPQAKVQFDASLKGIGVPNLHLSSISKTLIPLPPLETQKQIVKNLDKVTHLIGLCNTVLEKLDLLVKSRFVEMFGNPFINPFGWDEVSISAVVGGKVSNGFFSKRDDYIDDGNVAVLGVANVVNRMYSQVFDLPRTNATQIEVEKFSVKYGDMLFCRSSLVAAGIGKASIVPENTPNNILFECHVIRLPLDLNKCVPEYMQVLSTMDYFRNQIISQSKTATMTTISQEGIMNANIILPPLEKQKMFYDYVKQVHKSKFAVKKLLDKAETLKKALMQKYFG